MRFQKYGNCERKKKESKINERKSTHLKGMTIPPKSESHPIELATSLLHPFFILLEF